ncbi:hypothetical protein GYMLUDRAFT_246002 [Collybiopsis luxurians FD-317 M1]|uniref:Uncharacterized protein n=1 Tax=Collybiopsis luxurians FD-317 M1 TaxID=944289 RepID=A0A0D0B5I4_9AGAR|nr:hypothetical protein GYMLUDRAFT_246002 [Collybiopsis luxurians FD-317 M1]
MNRYSRAVSTIMLQNATHAEGFQPGFDLPKFRDVVTPDLVQEGVGIVRAVLKPLLPPFPSDKHIKVCLDAATSPFVLRKIDPGYNVLLSLIALRHPILDEKNFSIEQTWEPLLQGVDKPPCLPDGLDRDAEFELTRGEQEHLKGSVNATNEPSLSHPRRALGDAVVVNGRSLSAIGPPPQELLPSLPTHAGSARPALISKGLPSVLHDVSHDLVNADNTLDAIEADLDFYDFPSATSSPLLDSDSIVLDSSLLVTWSDLHAPELSVNDPSPAAGSPNSFSFTTRDSCLVDPNLLATGSNFGYSSPPSHAPLNASVTTPFVPGAWVSSPTRTPSCEELGPAFLRSTPALGRHVFASTSACAVPVKSFCGRRPLSLPQSFHLTAATVVGVSDCAVKGRYLSRVSGALVSGNWKRIRTLEPPRRVSGGIVKVRRLEVQTCGQFGFHAR